MEGNMDNLNELGKDLRKYLEDVKKFTEEENTNDLESYEHHVRSLDEYKQRSAGGGTGAGDWTLTDVGLYVYRFQQKAVDKQEKAISDLKNGVEMEANDSRYSRAKREQLEALLRLSDRPAVQVWQALTLTMERIEELENTLFSLLRCLVPATPPALTTKSQLQEFRTRLQQLKNSKNGRVPTVVYKSLAAVDGLLSRMEEVELGNVERNEKSVKEVENDTAFDVMFETFSTLEFVLSNVSSQFLSGNDSNLSQCDTVLTWSNEMLKSTEDGLAKIGPGLRRKYRMGKRSLRPTVSQSKKPRGGGGESSRKTRKA
ncbi:hypothetical protein PanWU01x14_349770 [Parasponia andersonii]|uniref:Uncharacterized protein n=1 Tax=Parasponia andersonii TaxID=3476 RepID=A0A2P5AB76_PARAD|nr:hypothetical protein PanWU01x14_349770 [Parasponia andersonii]